MDESAGRTVRCACGTHNVAPAGVEGGRARSCAGVAIVLISGLMIVGAGSAWIAKHRFAAPPPVAASSLSPAFPPLASLADAQWPADGQWMTVDGGIGARQFAIPNGAGMMTNLLIYLPKTATATAPVPCVFVAPAGSNLLSGMHLSASDTPEQLPYARAGFAVVAYSICGALPISPFRGGNAVKSGPTDSTSVDDAFDRFSRAQAGYADAEAAIAYAIACRPEIDSSRMFVAGHSSAATTALLVASRDPRILGCCAYAPVVDVEQALPKADGFLNIELPGARAFARQISPTRLPVPTCRLLLFHADDDPGTPGDALAAYAKRVGARATYLTVPTGGHYRSMIDQGIPAGIRFLTNLTESK